MTNNEFSQKDSLFNKACLEAKLKPCGRQASKYRRQKGLAYKVSLRLKKEEESK